MSSSQISEWKAYDTLDPIGQQRADFHMANMMALISNIAQAVYAKKDQKPKPLTPQDFLPQWGESSEEQSNQSIDEQKQILKDLARYFGGK